MSNAKLSLVVRFSALDQMSGALRNIIGLGRSGTDSLRNLNRQAGQIKREMAEAGRAIDQGTGNVTDLINRQRELERQLGRTNREIEQQQRILAVEARADAIAQRGGELRARGQENMIAGAAMLAPFILAAREAGNFSSGMVDLQQKANLTNREAASLAAQLLRVADITHQMPEDMRAVVDVMGAQGLDPRQAILLAPAIGRLSTAFKVAGSDGANAGMANLTNLHVPINQAAMAFDIMAASANSGAFEVSDMARHFPSLTAQMAALGEGGLSAVGNLAAALQIARRGTGTADEAANNVTNLIAKINSPSTIAAFRRNFGVDLPAAMRRLRAEGHDTFEAIAMITSRATRGDLSRLGFAFEDMQAQGAIRTLIQNLDDYRAARDAASSAGGTVNRAFDQRVAQDATVQWRSFMVSASTLAIILGNSLLPAIADNVQWLIRASSGVVAWAQQNPALANGIMRVVTGLIMARIGFGALQFAIGGVLGPLSTVYRLFATGRAMGIFTSMLSFTARNGIRAGIMLSRAFGIIRVATLFLARGVMQAGMMMLANPVVLAITAIVLALAGAAYLIYTNWDAISGYFQTNWVKIRNIMLGLVVVCMPWVAAVMWVASQIYRNWDLIKAATMWMVDYVRGRINAFIAPFIMVAGYLSRLAAQYYGYVEPIVGVVTRPFMRIITYLMGLSAQFWSFGRNIVMGLINGIASMHGALNNAILNGLGSIGSWFAAQLGIRSPSRVFLGYGQNIVAGLALGIDGAADRANRSVADLARGAGRAMAVGGSALALSSPFAAAAGAGGQRASGPVTVNVSITVNARDGESANDLALRIKRIIDSETARAGRSSYGDR